MMVSEKKLQTIRIVSVVAATIVALGCGSNYAFSAWGPQFKETMELSSTEINYLSTAGNWGMYLVGIPMGKLVDSTGARLGALLGAILFGLGYGGLYHAYTHGPGTLPLPVLCILAAFTGAGGCVAFLGAMKSAAVNFPAHKGTATAFPLAAFGLSAFFFANASSGINDEADTFLLFATIGTTILAAAPIPFLRTTPLPPSYTQVPTEAPQSTSLDSKTALKSKTPELSKKRETSLGPGTQYAAVDDISSSSSSSPRDGSTERASSETRKSSEENIESAPERADRIEHENSESIPSAHHSLYADVRGFAMLKYSECYELFLMVGLLTGIGLMTINNIGETAKALWTHWDPNTDASHVRHYQRVHVSIISICNFSGRLISGIGSDFIVKSLRKSRFWCLFASSCVFAISQAIGMFLDNPNFLVLLSGATGLAYGMLFGVSPTLVAETFGVGGLSQNWGFMTLGPALFGEVFDAIYGKSYDNHSIGAKDSKELQCLEGRNCYRIAYTTTFVGAVVAMFVTLWCIRHRHVKEAKIRKLEEDIDDDHLE